jgi:hypothetical protein
MRSTFCVTTAESAVFCVSQTKCPSNYRTQNRSHLWPKIVAATLTLVALALTCVIVSTGSEQTALVARHVHVNRAELQDLLGANIFQPQARNAPSPAKYSELVMIPASTPKSPMEKAPSTVQTADLKKDFDSNLRLLKAAGGLDMSKVPHLGGSSQVVLFVFECIRCKL